MCGDKNDTLVGVYMYILYKHNTRQLIENIIVIWKNLNTAPDEEIRRFSKPIVSQRWPYCMTNKSLGKLFNTSKRKIIIKKKENNNKKTRYKVFFCLLCVCCLKLRLLIRKCIVMCFWFSLICPYIYSYYITMLLRTI